MTATKPPRASTPTEFGERASIITAGLAEDCVLLDHAVTVIDQLTMLQAHIAGRSNGATTTRTAVISTHAAWLTALTGWARGVLEINAWRITELEQMRVEITTVASGPNRAAYDVTLARIRATQSYYRDRLDVLSQRWYALEELALSQTARAIMLAPA